MAKLGLVLWDSSVSLVVCSWLRVSKFCRGVFLWGVVSARCRGYSIIFESPKLFDPLNQLWFLRSYNPTWITVVILELIHDPKLRPFGKERVY